MFSGTKHLCLLLHSGAAILLLVPSVSAQVQPSCQPSGESSAALFITANCTDELYNQPIIDSQTNHTEPVPHLLVSGHFYNTTTNFNFYLPPKSNWGGRFYQFVYPTQTEDVEIEHITFGIDSQAYVVQVTGANGVRHEAAAAKFSRVVAQRYYQSEDHIYGYIYGGSGGSFQTVGALENTVGVWDGGLPMVQGIPISAPNGFSARSLFGHVLHPKMTQIQDALKPGGSGDPYESLNNLEKDILRQATLFGIPLRSWEDLEQVGNRSVLSVQEPFVESVDPTFSQDFWTKPGYLGTESGELGDLLRDSLVEFEATIIRIQRDSDDTPIALELSNTTRSGREQYDGWSFDISVSSANGTDLGKLRGQLNETTRVISLRGIGLINEVEVLNNLTEGTNVAVSNRDFVALHSFYRHQIPDRAGFIGFDQYRNTANGSARFPQRPMDASKVLSEAICGGCTHTGRINAKVIVVQNLLDSDAFPWFADWYRSQIQQTLGEKELEESYRVYYNDHSDHSYNDPPKSRSGFIVNFNGIYEQAMRDLNAWVERGVAPPPSTNYSITSENLVRVPDNAAERAGIQPVAHLNIVGDNCTSGYATGDAVTYSTYTAAVGEELLFSAHIEVPPGTGKIIDLEWDLFGTMDYVSSFGEEPNAVMDVTKLHSYTEPGNYTVALRVTSQREGKKDTAFARVRNLVRMHVEVQ